MKDFVRIKFVWNFLYKKYFCMKDFSEKKFCMKNYVGKNFCMKILVEKNFLNKKSKSQVYMHNSYPCEIAFK